ncbi:MAG: PDZ domain-containing protein [Candidatus Competibacterales bacterium]
MTTALVTAVEPAAPKPGATGTPPDTPEAPPLPASAPQAPQGPSPERAMAEPPSHRDVQRQLDQLRLAVEQLALDLVDLDGRLAAATLDPEETEDPDRDPEAPRRGVNVDNLLAGGFTPSEALMITQRWNDLALERLYLRDQAQREGWLDTPRYREAQTALGNESLRQELGDRAYDQLLYASGQSNRVAVASLIEGSPAQMADIQPGDTIVRYDQTPIYRFDDLQQATAAGVADELVTVEVQRGEQRLELILPRGPLGVRLRPRRLAPE